MPSQPLICRFNPLSPSTDQQRWIERVLGCDRDKAKQIIKQIYRRGFVLIRAPGREACLETSLTTRSTRLSVRSLVK
jgi:hypothetical protein